MNNILKRLEETRDNYNYLWEVAFTSESNAQTITETVKERINLEKKQISERIEFLIKQAADTSRSDPLRELAKQEITKLQSIKFSPTEEETTIFEKEIAKFDAALKDIRKATGELKDTMKQATAAIESIHSEMYSGGKDIELTSRRLESAINNFNKLL